MRHARALDRQHSAGLTPIEDRLKSFTEVRALVFGAYGEASSDVHALLTEAASRMAAKEWRRWGARTQAEARSFFIASLRRQLGVHVVREMARHRLRRVPYIGVERAVLERRRDAGVLGTGGQRQGADGGPQAVDLYVHQAWARGPNAGGR